MSKYKLPKIEELLESGVHFGHQVRRWHPKMEPYIYTVKRNIHIINLEKTEEALKNSCEALYNIAAKGGQIVFVGTKRQARDIVEIEAKRCGAFFVTERWLGGTITNYRIIKKNTDKLVNLIQQRETGVLEKYTKKERLLIDREIDKLKKNVGGIVGLKGNPDMLFIVDARREKTAIREANQYNIPVVALLDTNSDPSDVSYVIPGNDDAIKSVAIILKTIGDAVEAGYKDFAENKIKENEASTKEVVPAKSSEVKDKEESAKKTFESDLKMKKEEKKLKIPAKTKKKETEPKK